MRHVVVIFQKQLKDTLKNKTILIQFIMFPILTMIMENAVKIEGMPEHFFATLFAVMYVGMAPLTSMAAILSEEKEKNTLRVLLMSNVKPAAYLLGVGIYIWLICMLGTLVIGVSSGYTGKNLLHFILAMALGILVSTLIGAAVGTFSKNQMMATSISVPLMMIFAFLPMLAMFNDTIGKFAKITYSQQLHQMLSSVGQEAVTMENMGIILCNMLLAVIAFFYAYKRCGLE